jgi:hypothetical protein
VDGVLDIAVMIVQKAGAVAVDGVGAVAGGVGDALGCIAEGIPDFDLDFD